MLEIITALGNPKFNEELNEKIKIKYKDIQYKEGILEILEKNNKINLIIINEKLPGKIEINFLMERILKINSEIKIYLILEKEKNIIKNNNIYFFYNNENVFEKIKEKIFIEENNTSEKNSTEKITKNYSELIIENKNKYSLKVEREVPKYIFILGQNGIGKSIIASILSMQVVSKKFRVLLVDIDIKNGNLHTIFQVKKDINKIQKIKNNLDFICTENIEKINEEKYDFIFIDNYNKKILKNNYLIIFISEANLIGIEKSKKILFNLNNKYEKIILLINYFNNNSIDIKIIKNIFEEIKNIYKIKYDEKYNLLINNFNKFYCNLFFKKQYKEIINKII